MTALFRYPHHRHRHRLLMATASASSSAVVASAVSTSIATRSSAALVPPSPRLRHHAPSSWSLLGISSNTSSGRRQRFLSSSATTSTTSTTEGGGGGGDHPNTNSTASLSSAGKLFFGSLCAGTFALGCWQTQRLFEKQTLIEERSRELQNQPVTSIRSTEIRPGSFQRLELSGQFDHTRELLVGPRGAPKGNSDTTTGGYGGNMPSPQGYYVVTPFVTLEGDVVMVNRGWVPRTLVVVSPSSSQQQQNRQRRLDDVVPAARMLQWSRPTGVTTIRAVPSALEKPRFLVANHNFKERPIQFYWFDVDTMKQLVQRDDAVLLTSYYDATEIKNNKSNNDTTLYEPVQPNLESLQEFKVSPPIHAAYAFTWFSLSLAGLVMTRRLASGSATASAEAARKAYRRP